MRKLFGALAALVLAMSSSLRAHSVKDGLLILPYAAKAVLPACVLFPEREWFDPAVQASLGLAILAATIPDLMVLGAFAGGDAAGLRKSRYLAFYGEMASSAIYLVLAVHVLGRGSRGDEVGFIPLALFLPMALLAQLNHIPFDAEAAGPPTEAKPVFRIRIPF